MTDKISHEQIKEILIWAIGSAGMAHVLHFSPQPTNDEEAAERLATFEKGIGRMIAEMPEPLRKAGMELAVETAQEVRQDDAIVEAFMAEVDEYL